MDDVIEEEHQRGTDEDEESHLNARFLIDLRHDVAGGNVDGDPGGYGKAYIDGVARERHEENAGEGGGAEHDGRTP